MYTSSMVTGAGTSLTSDQQNNTLHLFWIGRDISGGNSSGDKRWTWSSPYPTYAFWKSNPGYSLLYDRNFSATVHEILHSLSLFHPYFEFSSGNFADDCDDTPPIFKSNSNNIMDDYVLYPGALSQQQVGKVRYYLLGYGGNQNDILLKSKWCTGNDDPIVIQNGEDVTWTQERYYNGSIIVSGGAELHIETKISLPQNGYIYVKPGGKLYVENAEIGPHDDCTGGWGGIVVLGQSSQSQSFSQQGYLQMTNSTIFHAGTGILVGGHTSNDSTGGMIVINSSEFINCGIGIEMKPYSTSGISGGYIIGNTFSFDNNNRGFITFTGIKLNGLHTVKIYGNSFEGDNTGTVPGTGIYAVNSGMWVKRGNPYNVLVGSCYTSVQDQNAFSNLITGIHFEGNNPNGGMIDLEECLMTRVDLGIDGYNNTGATIWKNSYQREEDPFVTTATGIRMEDCDGFDINTNVITLYDNYGSTNITNERGIHIINSGTDVASSVYNNILSHVKGGGGTGATDLGTGLLTEQNNSLLTVECNQFNNFSIAWYNASFSTIKNQGSGAQAAGNKFVHNGGSTRINNQNNGPFNYYYWNGAANENPAPLSGFVNPIPTSAQNQCTNTACYGTPIAREIALPEHVEQEHVFYVNLYPNPSGGSATFEYGLPGETEEASLVIFDLQGRPVSNISLKGNSGQVILDGREWQPGIYFYRVSANNSYLGSGNFSIIH